MANLFDLEEDRLREGIIERGAKRVLVQLPEGLKTRAPQLACIIEEAGALAIISADPCYGACDLPFSEAHILGADLIVHYGHTWKTIDAKSTTPILYLEARATVDTKSIVEEALAQLKPWSRIGLATTVQHIGSLEQARKVLQKAGKTVFIGHARHIKHPGQVLGCDYSNVKSIGDRVEAFLFVGGGKFHAIGLALATMKPTIVADPFENRVYSVDSEAQKIVRRRWTDISQASKATSIGVIIGVKTGQKDMETALRVKEYLKEGRRKAVLLVVREITPSALIEFPSLEAFVNTACPRISLEESGFMKPVLNVKEAYVMLGKIKWEELLKEGLV